MVYTMFLATEPMNSIKCSTSLENCAWMKIAKSEPYTRQATYA